MKKIFLLLFLLPTLVFSFQYKLSIGAIFRDEADYLEEWINYHKRVGVEHFWLYNNNSVDNYLEVLAPYINQGIVTLIDWPSTIDTKDEFYHFCYQVQIGAYNDSLARARHVSKWLALIDTDEFIVPSFEKDVITVLETHYKHISGLCVNWQLFGTSGVKKVEKGQSMLKQMIWKMRWDCKNNYAYKSIVQPLHVSKCVCPHRCEYLPNHWQIKPNYERVHVEGTGVHIEHIRLHHYWARDEWFFHNIKLPRQTIWKRDPNALIKNLDLMYDEKDYTIHRFLD